MEELHNKPVAAVAAEPEEQTIKLTDLLRHIKARWRWYMVSIIIALIVATLYIMSATPLYTRTSDILLKDDSSQSVTADMTLIGINSVPASILNEMFILSSPELMEQVVTRLGLNDVYRTPDGLRKQELYKNSPIMVQTSDSTINDKAAYAFTIELNKNDGLKTFTIKDFKMAGKKVDGKVEGTMAQPVVTPIGTFTIYPTKFITPKNEDTEVPTKIFYTYIPLKLNARSYCSKLKTEYAKDRGDVISMTIECETAEKATDILNTIVETYNELWVGERSKTAVATSSFIDDRLKSIESELGDVESNITEYKSSHRMMDMDAMAAIYLNQSTENQRILEQLAQDMAMAKLIQKELSQSDLTILLPATADIANTNISQLVSAYNAAVSERNLKLVSMPEDSPLIKQKTEALLRQRAAILTSVETALETLNSRYNAVKLVDRETQEKLASAPGQAKYLMSEERKQKVKESLYVYLLQRREENELSQAFTAYNTRMVTEPFGPLAPTSPRRSLIYIVALIIAIIVPTLIIYLQEVMNTRVRSRRDIEDLPIPFLGEIPLSGTHKKLPGWMTRLARKKVSPTTERPLVVRNADHSVGAEAFRMVRTNLDFMRVMQDEAQRGLGRVIMVVSYNAGSGKTYVSLNTAASYAIKGAKVCLIDFDLRKGTVSHNAGNPPHGLTDYLIGRNNDVDSLIVHNIGGIEGFDILPEGLRPPNPTELLYTPRLAQMIEHLRKEYDYIFFDCPPVEIVADARILNEFVDTTLFVMRAGLFERSDLPTLAEAYSTNRYNNIALVLNATDSVHGVYGQYGYGYSKKKQR